jgi:hypothetical protein
MNGPMKRARFTQSGTAKRCNGAKVAPLRAGTRSRGKALEAEGPLWRGEDIRSRPADADRGRKREADEAARRAKAGCGCLTLRHTPRAWQGGLDASRPPRNDRDAPRRGRQPQLGLQARRRLPRVRRSLWRVVAAQRPPPAATRRHRLYRPGLLPFALLPPRARRRRSARRLPVRGPGDGGRTHRRFRPQRWRCHGHRDRPGGHRTRHARPRPPSRDVRRPRRQLCAGERGGAGEPPNRDGRHEPDPARRHVGLRDTLRRRGAVHRLGRPGPVHSAISATATTSRS